MKIFQSRSSFELSAQLNEIEVVLYREAFHKRMPVTVPELGSQKFVVQEMAPYAGNGMPENAWRLILRQEAPEGTMPPADSTGQSLQENNG